MVSNRQQTSLKSIQVGFNKTMFPFLEIPRFYRQNIPNFRNDGSRQSLVLTAEMIQQNNFTHQYYERSVWAIVETFLKAVYGSAYGPDHPANQNLFPVIYEQNRIVFFGSPAICKWNNKAVLLFGSENKEQGTVFNLIPMAFPADAAEQITLKDSAIKSLEPSQIEVADTDSKDPQAKKKVSIIIFGAEKITFNLNLKVADSLDYIDFKDVWNTKKEDAITGILSGIYGFTASYSYMFQKWFATGRFPSRGIVLKIVGGRYITTGKYPSMLFTMDNSELPSMDVQCIERGSKVMFDAPLNEVTGLFCGTTQSVAQQFINNLLPKPTPDAPWYLHVTGQGKAANTVPRDDVYEPSYIVEEVLDIITAQKEPAYLAAAPELNFDDKPF